MISLFQKVSADLPALVLLSISCVALSCSPGQQTISVESPRVDERDIVRRFETGSKRYEISCMMCHGWDGRGDDRAPPLVESPWLNASPDKLVRILLHGLQGDPQMPSFSHLPDSEIAAVLTYLTMEWGHRRASIDSNLVNAVRRQTQERDRPWTAEELDSLSLIK